MIELTEINTEITIQPNAFLSLPIDSRIKSRLKVELDDGREAGLFLPRGHILRGGEQLKSQCGMVVEVKAAPEKVSTVYCSDLHLLTRVAYHLGNRHVPLQVEFGWVRYQHDHVLDEMVEGLVQKSQRKRHRLNQKAVLMVAVRVGTITTINH